MYKKGSKGWLKHFDFILLDMICLQIAFLLAYVIRHDSGSPYIVPLYRNMAIFMELLDIVVMFFYETLSNVLKRGYFREFAATVKHVLLVELFSVLYLFTMQEGQAYSRTALYLTGVIYAILTYIVRIIWKKILRSRMSEGNRSLLVVTTKDMAEQVVHNIRENNYERFALSGLVIIDDDLCGTKIAGVPVVANEENAAAYVCREWIDEVFVIPATDVPYPYALMEQFTEAGVTVHLNLAKVSEAMGGKKQLVEKVGPYTVLTTSINYASTKQLFMKRAIDIAGGLFGCLLTLLITLFVGPAIYLKSPGPIFFAQERVGKNGKKFKMYKFRSMYMDAEERKAELMKQNRVSDGMMFKLDFDPRVIGNEILPDGTKKTGIGNFIRVTSLDEFPQFFNVLKGDMSIVGTRPPTLDEWNKYELHHRARLAIKPGITGMWQVSGRSEITDFEEVVKLDTEYISEWNVPIYRITQKHNWNLLLCDLRAQGDSEGEFSTLGVLEKYDCLDWVEWAQNRFGDKNPIFLMGVSMGASIVMMSSDLELPDSVYGIIDDCGFTSTLDVIKQNKNKQISKYIPKNLFPTMLNVGTKIWGSFDLSDADACKALAHTDIPLLIIHGDEDMQAPLSMAYKLYDSCNGEKQLYIVHGADHAENYRKDPGGYEKIVTKFIEECIERKDD